MLSRRNPEKPHNGLIYSQFGHGEEGEAEAKALYFREPDADVMIKLSKARGDFIMMKSSFLKQFDYFKPRVDPEGNFHEGALSLEYTNPRTGQSTKTIDYGLVYDSDSRVFLLDNKVPASVRDVPDNESQQIRLNLITTLRNAV